MTQLGKVTMVIDEWWDDRGEGRAGAETVGIVFRSRSATASNSHFWDLEHL